MKKHPYSIILLLLANTAYSETISFQNSSPALSNQPINPPAYRFISGFGGQSSSTNQPFHAPIFIGPTAGKTPFDFAQDDKKYPSVSDPSKDSTYWKTGGFTSINFNQVQLVNWAAGGQNALAISGVFNAFADRYFGEGNVFENSADLAYGVIRTQDNPVRKNDDRIELNSKYGKRLKDPWYLSGLMNFRTQFADGYNLPNDSVRVSRFLAPAYLLLAVGFDYKPTTYFSAFFSPVTAKFTFVNDRDLANQGAYGLNPADTVAGVVNNAKRYRSEFGASIMLTFKKDLNKNVSLASKLLLFNNYTDPVKNHRDNIDVNFDMLLSMKLNKYFATMISVNLIYDHDIDLPTYTNVNGIETQTGKGPKLQLKEVFGIGFSYKFGKERK